MRRRIEVNHSELLQLREQGLSNHDIAKCLEISCTTVLRYIGKQNKRMERLEAFKEVKSQKEKEMPAVQESPKMEYEPKLVCEKYHIGNELAEIELNRSNRTIHITTASGSITLAYEELPDLVQFLAWAMRVRMDVGSDV